MSNFFQNPAITEAVVQRVPCKFAKPTSTGTQGTHYVIILKKNDSAAYISCECLDQHGNGIQFFEETDNTTCYTSVNKLKKALKTNQYIPAPSKGILLEHAVQEITYKARSKFIDRKEFSYGQVKDGEDIKSRIINMIINRLVGNILNLERTNNGPFLGDFPQVLAVKNNNLVILSHYWLKEIAKKTVLGNTQHWEVFTDEVRLWAKENHTFHALTTCKKCIFCGGEYIRMSKHTGSANHINKVLNLIKIVCKAISPVGVKLLMNPKYKNIFYGKTNS